MWRFVRHSTHSVDFLDISEDGHEIALKVALRHQHILYPNTAHVSCPNMHRFNLVNFSITLLHWNIHFDLKWVLSVDAVWDL